MREKIFTSCLIILVVLFIPIFMTTIFNSTRVDEKNLNTISIKTDYGQGVIEIPLEAYIIGVVAAEMPAEYELEALKAQAIAARTYVMKRYNENKDLVFTSKYLSYYSDEELEELWGVDRYALNYSKIKKAVEQTDQLIITYAGVAIDAIFHSTSIGKTRPALEVWGEDIPYLQGVESLEDINSASYEHQYSFSYDVFSQILMANHPDLVISEELMQGLQIIERSTSGYVLKLQIGNKIFSGEEIRRLLDLASSCFTITFENNKILFVCKGVGHGVGMSQVGANAMALEGLGYQEIILHYYSGVEIENTSNE